MKIRSTKHNQQTTKNDDTQVYSSVVGAQPRRSKLILVFLALVVSGGLIAGALFMLTSRDEPQESVPTQQEEAIADPTPVARPLNEQLASYKERIADPDTTDVQKIDLYISAAFTAQAAGDPEAAMFAKEAIDRMNQGGFNQGNYAQIIEKLNQVVESSSANE